MNYLWSGESCYRVQKKSIVQKVTGWILLFLFPFAINRKHDRILLFHPKSFSRFQVLSLRSTVNASPANDQRFYLA